MTATGPLESRLGSDQLAQLVRTELVKALTNSCDDASLAYRSSTYSDGFTYGTARWRFGLGWVADALVAAATARLVKLGHLRLALVGEEPGCLVYPIAVGKTAKLDPQDLRIKPSRLRHALFSPPEPSYQMVLEFEGDPDEFAGDNGTAPPPATLGTGDASDVNDGDDAANVEGSNEAELEDAALDGVLIGQRPAGRVVLLLAYTSNPTNGLLAATIGEALMAEDGSLTFLWCEQLQIRGRGNGGGGLQLVDGPKPAGPDFTTGAEPELQVSARTAEQASGATGTSGVTGPPSEAG